jgi:hypothetical protein
MAKKPEFPKTLYAKIEGEGDEAYFTTFQDMYGLAEPGGTVKIATYELVRVDKVELLIHVKGEE